MYNIHFKVLLEGQCSVLNEGLNATQCEKTNLESQLLQLHDKHEALAQNYSSLEIELSTCHQQISALVTQLTDKENEREVVLYMYITILCIINHSSGFESKDGRFAGRKRQRSKQCSLYKRVSLNISTGWRTDKESRCYWEYFQETGRGSKRW